MGYIIPISIFVLLLASSWDLIIKDSNFISNRGYIIIFCGLVSVYYGWEQYTSQIEQNLIDTQNTHLLLKSIEREGTRLRSNDFQIRLQASAHLNAFSKDSTYADYIPPKYFDLLVVIDEISVTGQFIEIPKSKKEYSGRGSLWAVWNYNGSGLFVEGLSKLAYLDQLVGKTLKVYIPRQIFGKPFRKKPSSIKLTIYIKGREIVVEQETKKSGIVEILLTKAMLNG